MSDQQPLVPPAPPTGDDRPFEPYVAPAWGDPAGEAPAGMQPAPPAPYQVAPQYLVNPGAPTHPLAITALVLGIVGIVSVVLTPLFGVTLVGGLCSPFAIWLGAWARRQIRADPQTYGGEGIATAGFVTGIVGLGLGLLVLLFVVAFVALILAVFAGAGA
ncbi:DUF4190 domain-containing protein [Nocardioides sp. SYSU DS0651]|uniref:DUF4190 domain-containing protein n=1 Tax=Nocardioides sp. SYSU DS0651 TaxID=3415955 RepID=UPI003F4C10A1